MAEPLDHQIVQEVARLLRDIRVANGYRTDAGQYVLSEENHDEIPDDATVLEVLDDDESVDGQRAESRKATLQLTITVNYPAGAVDQTLRGNARRVLADIRQALGNRARQQFPVGVLDSIELAGRTMFVREAGSRYFRPELSARITFVEQHRSFP